MKSGGGQEVQNLKEELEHGKEMLKHRVFGYVYVIGLWGACKNQQGRICACLVSM